jgi:hypothetical protein
MNQQKLRLYDEAIETARYLLEMAKQQADSDISEARAIYENERAKAQKKIATARMVLDKAIQRRRQYISYHKRTDAIK